MHSAHQCRASHVSSVHACTLRAHTGSMQTHKQHLVLQLAPPPRVFAYWPVRAPVLTFPLQAAGHARSVAAAAAAARPCRMQCSQIRSSEDALNTTARHLTALTACCRCRVHRDSMPPAARRGTRRRPPRGRHQAGPSAPTTDCHGTARRGAPAAPARRGHCPARRWRACCCCRPPLQAALQWLAGPAPAAQGQLPPRRQRAHPWRT